VTAPSTGDALLVVATMRRRGVPARSRVGFAARQGHARRIVATYREEGRWVVLDPSSAGFVAAGEVWLAYRDGILDGRPYGGGAAVRDAVLLDLAHANGDEVALTDVWGPMGPDLVDDLDVIDELAALLVAASAGSPVADRELAERYASDHRIRAPRTVAPA
jgi:hypothetical protein